MGTPDDHELLASGDPEDFGVLYSRHVATVTSYLGRRAVEPDVTFDLVAETFARALEHRARYDAARGPAIAWLLTIARNLIIDAARRGRVADEARLRLGMERIELDDAQLARIEEQGRLDFRVALDALPADQREAVILRVLVDEPYPLIAERVGCSEQVVRQRVSRGLAALRRSAEEAS